MCNVIIMRIVEVIESISCDRRRSSPLCQRKEDIHSENHSPTAIRHHWVDAPTALSSQLAQ